MRLVAERVALGVRFLDEHDPGWWRADIERAIDLDSLDLGEPQDCVLGQRCPVEVLAGFDGTHIYASYPDWSEIPRPDASYAAYAIALSGLDDRDALAAWGAAHGFAAPAEGWGWEYPALTEQWRRVITARRTVAAGFSPEGRHT